jgi:hypothetical protein
MSNSPLMTGYVADRSPTGVARSLPVSRESLAAPWAYLPDEGGARRTVYGPLPLYATSEEATLAARFRWRCNQGRPRCARPVAIGSV